MLIRQYVYFPRAPAQPELAAAEAQLRPRSGRRRDQLCTPPKASKVCRGDERCTMPSKLYKHAACLLGAVWLLAGMAHGADTTQAAPLVYIRGGEETTALARAAAAPLAFSYNVVCIFMM